MKLTRQQIQHIADLARLELNDDEVKKYSEQLSAILGYIEQLKEVNTDDIEPTAQITGLENVFRKDKIEKWDKSEAKDALNQAPEKEDGHIKVKRVLG